MPRFKMMEYVCGDCGLRFEFLAEGEEVDAPTRRCECGGQAEAAVGAPGLQLVVKGNSDFGERQSARMKRRSWEHGRQRHVRDEAIDREREQLKSYVDRA